MSKAGLIALFGLLVALVPFIGIPTTFKTVVTVILGLLVLALGFLVREEKKWIIRALKGDHQADAYTENGLPAASDADLHTDAHGRAAQAGAHTYDQNTQNSE